MLPDSTKTRVWGNQRARQDAHSFLYAGTILEPARYPKADGKPLKARLVHFTKILGSGKAIPLCDQSVKFQSQNIRIALQEPLRNEPFSRKSKQELRAGLLFSDRREGIKNAWFGCVWSANLIFSVIHKRIKEAKQFTTFGFNGQSKFYILTSFLRRSLKITHLNSEERKNSRNNTIGFISEK